MASGHRCPRGREGARPGPGLMRAERGNPVRVRRAGAGMRRQGGRPTVRGAEFPGRTGCPGSGCRAAERRQESGAAGPGTPPGWLSYNWPGCRILLSGLERALTWAGEPLRRERAYVPELMGKLDTSVNGPDGLPPFDGDAWERTDWRHQEEQVRRLRSRIFKAAREGDWPLARNLQKLPAPRGALSYPRFSREELEGRFLGLMAYLDPKGEGNDSMPGKQRPRSGV